MSDDQSSPHGPRPPADDDLAARWKTIVSRHAHQWLSKPIEANSGDWTIEALAYRRALEAHFPTTVWTATTATHRFAWIETGQRTKQWRIVRGAETPEAVIAQISRDPSCSSGTAPGRWWIAEPVASSHTMQPIAFLLSLGQPLKWLFAHEIDSAILTWRRAQEAAYAAIGYRALNIAIPATPVPCPAIRIVSNAETWPARPLTYQDMVDTVRACCRLTCVPDPVAEVWERAVRLFLWGYQEWDFFTVAEHYIGLAADTSLRYLEADTWAYPARVEFSRQPDRSSVFEEFLARDPSETRIWDRPPGARSHWVNGQFVARSKRQRLRWAGTQHWVSPHEVLAMERSFQVRDMMSHPDLHFIQWIGEVRGLLLDVHGAMNGMWARRRHPDTTPWEGHFSRRPLWAAPASSAR